MSKKTDVLLDQIQQACELTGASWAAVVEASPGGLAFVITHGLKAAAQAALAAFFEAKKMVAWALGTGETGRVRTRATGELAEVLGCERMYCFAKRDSAQVLLVGAGDLPIQSRQIFQMVSNSLLIDFPEDLTPKEAAADFSVNNPDQNLANYPPESMRRVLTMLNQYIPADAAYLAVRAGNGFQVEATHHFPKSFLGHQIAIEENQVVAEILETQRGVILNSSKKKRYLSFTPPARRSKTKWLGVPLLIGTRVIGYLAFRNKKPYTPDDLKRAEQLAQHVAPPVEKTIVFSEAANHLQRLALLNELATAASAGADLPEITRRVRRMLGRIFRSSNVALLLPTPDGTILEDVADRSRTAQSKVYPIDTTLVGYAFETGKTVRVGDVVQAPRYLPINSAVRSKMTVPLKFHNDTIGVLALENSTPDAFSQQDEIFLAVIASQIASIIVNARLNVETLKRAHNLALINEIVQHVVGLTDLAQISQLAAALMTERFGYEMISIMLLDEYNDELVLEGVGGTGPVDFPTGVRISKNVGITGKVLADGESRWIEDAEQEPDFISYTGWDPGSQICVALREGEDIFGVINVETRTKFALSKNDLLALDALAGVLSSVMMYARRYRQLQNNVRQLQAVRETSLDISTDLDLNVLLKRVVTRVRELVDAHGAELALVDEDEEVVRVLVSDNPWQDYTGYAFPMMGGVAGRVAAIGEPLVVNDFNSWSGKQSFDHQAPFQAVAGVPLKLSGQVIGTLIVQDDRHERKFGPEEVQVLELLAPQLTIFIRNARLYQELEERMEAQRLVESRLVRSAKLAAVGEMAAGVAHELNNPLTTVSGFAELILDDLPEDYAGREDMELVLKEARRARDVVRRLLDFSRQSEILRVQADINEVLGNVLALVHHLARTSSVEIRVELWDGLPRIRIDRNQMQQVFLNLIHNALQAMPLGGELIIRTYVEQRDEADWVAVSIQDTGEGIVEEDLSQIFEPFFTTKPTGSGTGLGLSISYGIVSDHGGYIDVTSQVGVGSHFIVMLPVVPEEETADA